MAENRPATWEEMVLAFNKPTPRGWALCASYPEQLIKIEQQTTRAARFRVSYGLQVKTGLTYVEAAHEFGECMFHALACDSKLDNEGA